MHDKENPEQRKPFFTIITSTYNAALGIQRTADSIRSQRRADVQWIIADGGSNDGTLELIERNNDIASTWFSKHDRGIYDAWNSALKYIEGEWVIFLGAGDTFYYEDSLNLIKPLLESLEKEIEIAYGDVEFLNEHGTKSVNYERKIWSDISGKWGMLCPILPSHAGVFHRSKKLKTFTFDITLKIAGDTDYLVMCLQQHAFVRIDATIAKVVLGGVSTKIENQNMILREHKLLIKRYQLKVPLGHLIYVAFAGSFKTLLLTLLPKSWVFQVLDIHRSIRGLEKKWSRS